VGGRLALSRGRGRQSIKSPAMFHGECVSIGCVAEAKVALEMGCAPRPRPGAAQRGG
jgi:3-dehydroquinate synthetase